MRIAGFEIGEFSVRRGCAKVTHADDVSFAVSEAFEARFSRFGASLGACADELRRRIERIIEFLGIFARKRAEMRRRIRFAIGSGHIAAVAVGEPIALACVGIRLFGALLSEFFGDEVAAPV